jgi:hypothetical protein
MNTTNIPQQVVDDIKARVEKDHPSDYRTQSYLIEEMCAAFLRIQAATTPAAHTPGPWHTSDPFTREDGRELIGIGTGAEHIGYASVTCCVRMAEAQANARLIAAAPDLLAALVTLTLAAAELDRQADIASINPDQSSRLPCLSDAACVCKLALDRARAVIALAERGAQ